MKYTLIFTAEHASNTVPDELKALFLLCDLSGHIAYDIGVEHALRKLKPSMKGSLFLGAISRLVVDLNRSQNNPHLFSAITKSLPQQEREKLLEKYYTPYRRAVEAAIKKALPVLHLSVHSFTPELHGKKRTADIGLLYDPSRKEEKMVAEYLKRALSKKYSVRMNYPYRGTSDGFVTHLRVCFQEKEYVGLEIELNQRLSQKEMFRICKEIYESTISFEHSSSKDRSSTSH